MYPRVWRGRRADDLPLLLPRFSSGHRIIRLLSLINYFLDGAGNLSSSGHSRVITRRSCSFQAYFRRQTLSLPRKKYTHTQNTDVNVYVEGKKWREKYIQRSLIRPASRIGARIPSSMQVFSSYQSSFLEQCTRRFVSYKLSVNRVRAQVHFFLFPIAHLPLADISWNPGLEFRNRQV